MSILRPVNSKANIKQTSGSDMPANVSQNILNRYEADSSASQTVINMSFSVDQSNKDAFLLHIDGKLLREGAANDYTFTNVASDNTSSQVTLNSALPAGLNIIAIKAGTKIEAELQTDTRFVAAYDYLDKAFQGFVSQNAQLTATTTTGTPATGYFYSSISNRSSIVDLTADLKARMGVERVPVQSIMQLQTEFGPSNETVFSVMNDKANLIRFVGSGWANENTADGVAPKTTTSGDYIEITYYGTGLNLMIDAGYVMNLTYQINGSTATSLNTSTYSSVLDARNYNSNQIINVTYGQTLGVYTVRINQNTTTSLKVQGYEVVNESALIKTSGGTAYIQGKKITPASSAVTYNTGFTNVYGTAGTRGGRVLQYLDQSGNIKKDIQYTNTAQANMTNADHTNEDVARVYNWREFGVGRADDFAGLSVARGASFTLSDGVTSLVASSHTSSLFTLGYGPTSSTTGTYITFTFIGTGLDILNIQTSTLGSNTIIIDGNTSVGDYSGTTASGKILKIVSGLPYGTHSVKITNVSGVPIVPRDFIVYQPKKPVLPNGCIEITDCAIMADYTANTVAGADTVAWGALRKMPTREFLFSNSSSGGGTWTAVQTISDTSGNAIYSSTTNDFLQYTFFGTGFEIRWENQALSSTWNLTLDGATNFTASNSSPVGGVGWVGAVATNTSFYGAGVTSFTASTGVMVGSATATIGNGVKISGLTLGLHTVKFTKSAGTGILYLNSLDIITPVHSHKSNLYMDVQDSFTVGSQGLSDNRKTSAIKEFLPYQKVIAKKAFLGSISTSSSTPLPFDAGSTVKITTGKVRITTTITFTATLTTSCLEGVILIDGLASGPTQGYATTVNYIESSSSNNLGILSFSDIYEVSPGWHNFTLGIGATSGTISTRYGNFIVEEI
jgi:hypothetical protein